MADALFSNVVLLVHADGTAGSTAFTDASTTPKALTTRGAAAVTTTAGDFKIGTGAIDIPGSGAAVDTPSHADFQFGTGDFCVEAWIKTSDTAGGVIDYFTAGQSGSWEFFVETGKITWYRGDTRMLISGLTVSDGAWHHIAVSRQGTTSRVFVDGTLSGTNTDSGNYNYANPFLSIGRQRAGSPSVGTDLIAKLDGVRVTKGAARYTAAFTPPSTLADYAAPAAIPQASSIGPLIAMGTPKAALLTYAATIGPLLKLGTPMATQSYGATGIAPLLQLGTPRVYPYTVAGMGPLLRLGAPTTSLQAVSLGPLLQMGTPRLYEPAIQTSARGFRLLKMGRPALIVRTQARAAGLRKPLLKIGHPTAFVYIP